MIQRASSSKAVTHVNPWGSTPGVHVGSAVLELGRAVFGMWSGGHFMHFGKDIGRERLLTLTRKAYEIGIRSFITADVYEEGAADTLLGEALSIYPRDSYFLAGAIGHDFYKGNRQAEKGFPRFTDPALRGPSEYAAFLKMAAEKSLERLQTNYFNLLFLHNPDSIGYSTPEVWKGMEELKKSGLVRSLGLAPGPANGFVLDIIDCFEKFGSLIEWAMIILNPLEPWPMNLALPAAQKHNIKILARVVDSGGLFHGYLKPGMTLGRQDHRSFRPKGWIEEAAPKVERSAEFAGKYSLSLLQLACEWTLAQPAVESVVPTLVEEADADAKKVESQIEDLSQVNQAHPLPAEVAEEMTRIGNNRNCMSLKGASPQYLGAPQADQWPLTETHLEIARRWNIVPDRDLIYPEDPRDLREKGTPKNGTAQALDRRLYLQLHVFGNCRGIQKIKSTVSSFHGEAVLYADVNDPYGIGILTMSEDPEFFVREARCFYASEAFRDLQLKPELTMLGRTYSAGREADLEDWLLRKPRRNALNPDWPWAVWYPLRRKSEFELLPKQEQDKILFEHASVGRNYGQSGYAADIRLAATGLDKNDNEFILGLVGPKLHFLSRLVQDMRKTQQTAKYIQSLGPFFVGRVIWQSPLR